MAVELLVRAAACGTDADADAGIGGLRLGKGDTDADGVNVNVNGGFDGDKAGGLSLSVTSILIQSAVRETADGLETVCPLDVSASDTASNGGASASTGTASRGGGSRSASAAP